MGGLQGAGVGRYDDVFDPLVRQLPGGLLRLGMPEYGQARIDDPGITAGGAEVQVELALAVTQRSCGRP
jgi:hypothetical protein